MNKGKSTVLEDKKGDSFLMFTHNQETPDTPDRPGTDYAAIDDFNECMMLEMFSEYPDYGKCDTLEIKAKVMKEIDKQFISFDRPWVKILQFPVLCCNIMWVTYFFWFNCVKLSHSFQFLVILICRGVTVHHLGRGLKKVFLSTFCG